MLKQHMAMAEHLSPTLDRELKKGSAELLVLSLLEARQRHGYEISKQIEHESGGVLSFNVASLYPLLYRLEKRGWIQGRWVDKAGQRRRRYYQITPQGKKILKAQRSNWKAFVAAIGRIAGVGYA
jgi:PadR family transcriptional regulator, regulatory protein PadR